MRTIIDERENQKGSVERGFTARGINDRFLRLSPEAMWHMNHIPYTNKSYHRELNRPTILNDPPKMVHRSTKKYFNYSLAILVMIDIIKII